MTVSKIEAKEAIRLLVGQFKDHISEYKKSSYNEATLRIDFLNKFFKALGWDVDNSDGITPSFREVITEDRISVEGRLKLPDYSFRLKNGTRQFFVEAKKPEVNISTNAAAAFQVRRYGWNADIGISILTSFEYFAIYDCSSRPLETQQAACSRLKLIHFEEYLDSFDYIWDTFSRDSVYSGKLEKFKLAKHKKGSSSVDSDFLKSLDEWRVKLAKDIFKNNEIDEFQLNFVVQKLIDQIIFLRIAEDRDIELYGTLNSVIQTPNCYRGFLKICHQANDKYNSGLFSNDKIFEELKISDKEFSTIVNELYFPLSPYEFSVLPLDILGKAYEQFLGKVIVVDKKGKLSVTDKPEVKKAGGVFYTAKYIVESIVEETVGKYVENKTPEDITKLKILDPACGSGTFLLTAFEFLLNWHKAYYEKNKAKLSKKQKEEIFTPMGELTTKFKGKVLLNSIYGVDVDRNAVEVTKLSLLLKCLEGESRDTLKAQMSLFQERVLPTLDQNIVSGNSLVDFDIYGLSSDLEIDLKIKKKINAFNWETTFKNIFKDQGGFQVVIGNPPYVRQELFKELKPYLSEKYEVYSSTADLYSYFFEKSYDVMAPDGIFSIIVANKWFKASYGEPLRIWLKKVCVESIKDFGDLPVFKNATTYPCIIKIKKSSPKKHFLFSDLMKAGMKNPKEHRNAKYIEIKFSDLNDKGWLLADDICLNVLKAVTKKSIPLIKYVDGQIHYGLKTGLNDAFVLEEEVAKKILDKSNKYKDLIVPFLKGREIKGYCKLSASAYLIFIPKGWTKKMFGNLSEGAAFKKISEKYPEITSILSKYEDEAKARCDQGDYWWELRACDYYDAFKVDKIIYPNILKRPEFTFDREKLFTNQKCFIVPVNDFYLLGILNSEFSFFWFEMYLPKLRGGFYEPNYAIFKNFPVCQIDPENLEMVEEKSRIIDCVKKILTLESKDQSKDARNECLYYKNEINKSVYKIYGINHSESKHISEIIENVKR